MSLKIGEIKHIANSHNILLDIDNATMSDELLAKWRELIELCGLHWLAFHVEVSPSGSGVHAIIEVKERLRPIEHVAVQAILGSDPKREALNFRRKGKWNVLFSKKYELGEHSTNNFPQNK